MKSVRENSGLQKENRDTSQDRKLNILQIAPPVLPIGRYGGAEKVISELDKTYHDRGLESYVICSKDSIVRGHKLSPIEKGIWSSHRDLSQDEFESEIEEYCKEVLKYISDVNPDVVHDHMGFVKSETFKKSKNLPPILSTLHASDNYEKTMEYKKVNKNFNGNIVFFNTVSESQKKIFSKITDVDYVIYNGINVNDFPFEKDKKDYVFCMSSIYPEKGTETAINSAKEIDQKIVVAGPVHSLDDEKRNKVIKDYWENSIKPKIDYYANKEDLISSLENFLDSDKKVMYTGELNDSQKKHFFKNSKAFYAPIELEEAFGLTMVEANSCGTPVVAYKRGAVPEIIKHGVNGYQVNPQEIFNFISYAKKTKKLSPENCRKHVEKNFSLEKQVNNYISVYKDMINKSK